MIFRELAIGGAYCIEPEELRDARGFFARTWCQREFASRGLASQLDQCSISFNDRLGTLRGMHYQEPPHGEVKLVRCTAGAIYDVLVDVRPDSPTFRRWVAVELSGANRQLLYIPIGVAHGFLTLADGTEVFYQMTGTYQADSARGLRWNDPVLGIHWPSEPVVMADRDRQYPDFVV
jgi:dTDP-4-dehydrorhamnose 3,5-epimerase